MHKFGYLLNFVLLRNPFLILNENYLSLALPTSPKNKEQQHPRLKIKIYHIVIREVCLQIIYHRYEPKLNE